MPFRYRPLETADFPLIHRWLNHPHVARWWGTPPSLDEVASEYGAYVDGTDPVFSYVVFDGARAIGQIQWTRYADCVWYARLLGIEDLRAANCDVFIGEPDCLYRGLGAPIVRGFVREVIFADPAVSTCFIDPEQSNASAIRSYEKAGFRFVRDVGDDGQGKTVHLMELTRAALDDERVG